MTSDLKNLDWVVRIVEAIGELALAQLIAKGATELVPSDRRRVIDLLPDHLPLEDTVARLRAELDRAERAGRATPPEAPQPRAGNFAHERAGLCRCGHTISAHALFAPRRCVTGACECEGWQT